MNIYTIKDIMDILKISKNTAYDLVKSEGFPVIKIKSTYRVPQGEFEDWCHNRSCEISS